MFNLGEAADIARRGRLALHLKMASSQRHGPSFVAIAPPSRKLALTYDDGPNDPHTNRLMAVLDRHGVRATFFLIGQSVESHPHIARSLVAAGHAIGNHSYSHPDLTTLSATEVRDELRRATCAIEDVMDVTPALFRPPFGRRNQGVLEIARELGMTPVMWSAAAYDWTATSHEDLANTLRSQIRGGEVIQFHDGDHRKPGGDRSVCVRATDELVAHYHSIGFEFVTVTEMMASAESEVAVP